MKAVFGDTFYWIALTSPAEAAYERARQIEDDIVTTDEVLSEYLTFFSGASDYIRRKAVANVQAILDDPGVRVIPQSRSSFLAGLDLYRARPDKGYSITDCISMHTMRRHGLTDVLTNDRHFEQEGFRALFREARHWAFHLASHTGVVRYCWILALTFCVAGWAEDITPRVGVVEIYGARKVSLEKIKSAVGAKLGDPLPSREGVEDRIDKISGIVASRVEAACCDQRSMILYVGVQEKDSPHFEFRPAPTGDLALPAELAGNYHTFLDEVAASIRSHNADEDLTNGYSLMADPNCRQLQQTFIGFVARDLPLIDRVLRESADSEQRAIAAYVLQYGPRGQRTSKTIVDALQYALQDQEDTVRENAMRALQAVAVGAKLHPEQEIRIEPTWFVELMNSVVWSDRHGASLALVNLTDTRDPDTLALLRERALRSVVEMARWHDLEHALPPFILAGRLAGLDENSIKQAWLSGDREPVLKQALNPKSKKSREKNSD